MHMRHLTTNLSKGNLDGWVFILIQRLNAHKTECDINMCYVAKQQKTK